MLQNRALLRTHGFIDGCWVSASNGGCFSVVNPATDAIIAQVSDCGREEARAAINAASRALPAWRQLTAYERSALLRRWYGLIMANMEDLALLMTREQGKPLAEARAEIAYSASFIEWFAEEAKRVYGDIIPTPDSSRRLLVLKQPVGVVAAITPWNFPSAMITRKAGAALGVGCTMVLKPAAETPLSALALAALAEEAGIPPGVFNVVPGTDAEAIGREFTANNKVAKLSFTGSTEVGKQLLKDCANTVKKVSMELGGNAPALVFDDADLDMALDGVVASKYRNAGQTCICVNRVLVQGAIYDDFVARLKGRINTLIVGEGDRDGVLVGPLISAAAVDKVDGLISQACDSGAEIVCGGKPLARKGHFYEPTLVVNASSEMEIFKQEIFGPVTVVYRFEHEDEAIQQANGTRAGLAAYCYTRDAGRIWRLGERLEFGMVGINEVAISHAAIPFGGMKESGLGREGSRYGVDDYLEIKHVAMRV